MIAALAVVAAAFGPTPALAASRVGPVTDEPAIRISLNSNGRYRRGDKARVEVRTREDGYLLLLRVDADRRVRVLFPRDPKDDNFVRGGQDYEIKGRGNRETFLVDDGTGQGVVYAAISRDPFRFNEYELSDHWDFRALNTVQVGDEVEADLNDFVRKLAISDFDYDLQRYDVSDRAYASSTTYMTEVYGGGWGSPYWGSNYYGSCAGYWGCGYGGNSLFIGLGFGSPYYGRPFFYDPFYYDPYFYGPRYYAPVYYYPYPRYYGPAYYPRYPYNPGYRSPYRPRNPSTTVYARDFYHGGYYSSPWRRRDPRVGTSSYVDGRGTFGGSYVPGRLASGLTSDGTWRNRGVSAVPASSTGSSYTPRRTSDGRPTDMSPARGEGRRAAPDVVTVPSGRRPEARPADGRPAPGRRDVNNMPRQVGPVGEPRRLNDDARPLPQVAPPAGNRAGDDGAAPEPRERREMEDVGMPRAVGPGSTGRREVEARGPDRAPEPRQAEPRDVRSSDRGSDPAPRQAEPRDVRSSDRGSDPAPRPAERPVERPAPREVNHGERVRAPEPRPAMESGRREAPPPRAERPAPRMEGRGGNGGGNGGGGARRPSPRQ